MYITGQSSGETVELELMSGGTGNYSPEHISPSYYVGSADSTRGQYFYVTLDNLSVNGASDKISYFFNLGYMDQEGSYKSGSLNYHRWNFRTNVDAKITDRLRTTLSLSGYTDETNQPMTTIWAVYKKGWTYTPSSHPWIYTEDGQKLPNYDTEFLENENPERPTRYAAWSP